MARRMQPTQHAVSHRRRLTTLGTLHPLVNAAQFQRVALLLPLLLPPPRLQLLFSPCAEPPHSAAAASSRVVRVV